jgi:hypothetical protein
MTTMPKQESIMKTRILMMTAFCLASGVPTLQASPAKQTKNAQVTYVRYSGSAIFEASIRSKESARYQVSGSAGQHMTVRLVSNRNECAFTIDAPGKKPAFGAWFNSAQSGNSYDGVLPVSGTYMITVFLPQNVQPDNHAASYRLEIKINSEQENAKPIKPSA